MNDVKAQGADGWIGDQAAGVQEFSIETKLLDFGLVNETGQSYSAELEIHAGEFEGEELRVDFKFLPYDQEKYGKCDEASLKARDWLSFAGGNSSLSLKSGEAAKLKLRVYVPAQAELGRSQYAVLHAESANSSDDVLLKISLNGEKLQYGGEIIKSDMSHFAFDGDMRSISGLKNSGSMGFKAGLNLQFAPAFGLQNWQSWYGEERELMPGAEWLVTHEGESLQGKLREKGLGVPGLYEFRQEFSFVGADKLRRTETYDYKLASLPRRGACVGVLVGVMILVVVIVVVVASIAKRRKEESK